MNLCNIHVPGACGDHLRVSDHMELELQRTESCQVGAGLKLGSYGDSWYSKLLSALFSASISSTLGVAFMKELLADDLGLHNYSWG